MTDHLPVRPSWVCNGCGAEWPCQTRRKQLLAEYDRAPVSLSVLMASYMHDASRDLTDDRGELYDRMLGWTRRRDRYG